MSSQCHHVVNFDVLGWHHVDRRERIMELIVMVAKMLDLQDPNMRPKLSEERIGQIVSPVLICDGGVYSENIVLAADFNYYPPEDMDRVLQDVSRYLWTEEQHDGTIMHMAMSFDSGRVHLCTFDRGKQYDKHECETEVRDE